MSIDLRKTCNFPASHVDSVGFPEDPKVRLETSASDYRGKHKWRKNALRRLLGGGGRLHLGNENNDIGRYRMNLVVVFFVHKTQHSTCMYIDSLGYLSIDLTISLYLCV